MVTLALPCPFVTLPFPFVMQDGRSLEYVPRSCCLKRKLECEYLLANTAELHTAKFKLILPPEC